MGNNNSNSHKYKTRPRCIDKYDDFVHDFHEVWFCKKNSIKYSQSLYQKNVVDFEEFMCKISYKKLKKTYDDFYCDNSNEFYLTDSSMYHTLMRLNDELFQSYQRWTTLDVQ